MVVGRSWACTSQEFLFRWLDESEGEGDGVRNTSKRDSEGQKSFEDHTNQKQTLHLLPSANSALAWEELPPSTGTHLPQLAHIHLTFWAWNPLECLLSREACTPGCYNTRGCGVSHFSHQMTDVSKDGSRADYVILVSSCIYRLVYLKKFCSCLYFLKVAETLWTSNEVICGNRCNSANKQVVERWTKPGCSLNPASKTCSCPIRAALFSK